MVALPPLSLQLQLRSGSVTAQARNVTRCRALTNPATIAVMIIARFALEDQEGRSLHGALSLLEVSGKLPAVLCNGKLLLLLPAPLHVLCAVSGFTVPTIKYLRASMRHTNVLPSMPVLTNTSRCRMHPQYNPPFADYTSTGCASAVCANVKKGVINVVGLIAGFECALLLLCRCAGRQPT